MIITVVATLCHALAGQPDVSVCHEEIVTQTEMDSPTEVCAVGMPALAQWKMASAFADDAWTIREFGCKPGGYKPKDAI